MSVKLQTYEATVNPDGTVRLAHPPHLDKPAAALVTIAIERNGEPEENADLAALLSEEALSDWSRKEEDEAWAYLDEAS